MGAEPRGTRTIVLPADDTAPASARRFVGERTGDLSDETAYNAQVIVSELVTNAVRHGGAPVIVQFERRERSVVLSVHDCGAPMEPRPAGPVSNTAGSGRGLIIVAALCADWGQTLDAQPPGKIVWASLALDAAESG